MGYTYKYKTPNSEFGQIQLSCENQGCLDVKINLEENHGEHLDVEALMNQLNALIMDHRQYSEESLSF